MCERSKRTRSAAEARPSAVTNSRPRAEQLTKERAAALALLPCAVALQQARSLRGTCSPARFPGPILRPVNRALLALPALLLASGFFENPFLGPPFELKQEELLAAGHLITEPAEQGHRRRNRSGSGSRRRGKRVTQWPRT